jgi:hypothetical protein
MRADEQKRHPGEGRDPFFSGTNSGQTRPSLMAPFSRDRRHHIAVLG